MSMYDKVIQDRSKRKKKINKKLLCGGFAAILIAAMIIILCGPVAHHRHYIRFITDLSNDTKFSSRAECTHQGKSEIVTADRFFEVYRKLTYTQEMKEEKKTLSQEPDITVTYGNGSFVQIWAYAYEGHINRGIYFSYYGSNGDVFHWSTDLVDYEGLEYRLLS